MSAPGNGQGFPEMEHNQNEDSYQAPGSFLEYLYARARKENVPLHGTFELTPFCNFRCKMCYVQMSPEQMKGRKPLSTEQWKDLMHQAWEAGMINATLTGGECLSYPGFEELYLYLRSLGCHIDILTNAALLNERWVRFFRDHMPVAIQVTLYGNDEEAYERVTGQRAYGTVLKNLRLMQEAGLPLKLTVTPNRFLGEDVFDTIRFAKRFDKGVTVNTGLYSPREETGRSHRECDLDVDFYARIFRFLHEQNGDEPMEIPEDVLPPIGGPCHEPCECGLPCSAGRCSFSINWKGIMHPCNSLEVIEDYPLEKGFRSAWSRMNRTVCSWPQVPECVDCAYKPVCTNCTAEMLRFAEPGKQPVALCERTRYLVQHGAKRISDCE